LFITVGPV